MTARLTNAIGTRLGLTHSWKSKMVLNSKMHARGAVKREQGYNLNITSLFRKRQFKRQSTLRGQYIRYYNDTQRIIFDVLSYDTAFERIRRNIKHLHKYGAFTKKQGGQYYRVRNMKLLKFNKLPKQHKLVRGLRQGVHEQLQRLTRKNTYSIPFVTSTSVSRITAAFQTRRLRLKIKSRLPAQTFEIRKKYMADQKQTRSFRKLLAYYFGRLSFLGSARRLIQRFCYKRQWLKHNIKINLISVPKLYLTTKLIMAFIIKKLYLKYTLYESFRNFRKYFKLRALGYILRGCGKLTKKQRAWYVKRHQRKTKINNLAHHVDYAYAPVTLKYGVVGVKLWINY